MVTCDRMNDDNVATNDDDVCLTTMNARAVLCRATGDIHDMSMTRHDVQQMTSDDMSDDG